MTGFGPAHRITDTATPMTAPAKARTAGPSPLRPTRSPTMAGNIRLVPATPSLRAQRRGPQPGDLAGELEALFLLPPLLRGEPAHHLAPRLSDGLQRRQLGGRR